MNNIILNVSAYFYTTIIFFFSYAKPIELHFPKNFLMGAAIAEYQNSGAQTVKHSNWAAWEELDRPENPTIHGSQRSGNACDHWNLYKQDITLMQDFGFNAFRFSIDWSMIEPEPGVFNQDAIQHYHDQIDSLIAANITPMMTLHHFVHPQWFEELGAFEKIGNLKYFARFCIKMFEQFGGKVKLWCTINEPGPYVFQGYINKTFPPGICDMQLAATVLRNMLIAHVLIYRTLKALPGGNNAQIGLVHQYLTFQPYNSWNMIEKIPTLFLNYVFNDVILEFLKTGNYSFYLPFVADVKIEENSVLLPKLELENRPYFDFIGLNFYSRVVIQQQYWNVFGQDAVVPSCMPGEVMTDMPYPLYGQGLYEAIVAMSELGVPIYITENGVADAQDDRRTLFFQQYLTALSDAINDGYDVRGWFYWSLMDNFEWNDGYGPKFGLYEVNFETKERIMRPSAQILKSILADHTHVA